MPLSPRGNPHRSTPDAKIRENIRVRLRAPCSPDVRHRVSSKTSMVRAALAQSNRVALRQLAPPSTDTSWPTLYNPHFQRRVPAVCRANDLLSELPRRRPMVRTLHGALPAEPSTSFTSVWAFSARTTSAMLRTLNVPVASWSRFFDVAAASAFSLGQGCFRSSLVKGLEPPQPGTSSIDKLSSQDFHETAVLPPRSASRRRFARAVTRSC